MPNPLKFFGGNQKPPPVKIQVMDQGYSLDQNTRTSSTTSELLDRMDSRLDYSAASEYSSDYDYGDHNGFMKRYHQDHGYSDNNDNQPRHQRSTVTSTPMVMPAVREIVEEDDTVSDLSTMDQLPTPSQPMHNNNNPTLPTLREGAAVEPQRQTSYLSDALLQGKLEDYATESLRAMTLSATLVSEALGMPVKLEADSCLVNPMKNCVASTTLVPTTIHVKSATTTTAVAQQQNHLPENLLDQEGLCTPTWGMESPDQQQQQQHGEQSLLHEEDNIMVGVYHDPSAYTRSPRNHTTATKTKTSPDTTLDTSVSSESTGPQPQQVTDDDIISSLRARSPCNVSWSMAADPPAYPPGSTLAGGVVRPNKNGNTTTTGKSDKDRKTDTSSSGNANNTMILKHSTQSAKEKNKGKRIFGGLFHRQNGKSPKRKVYTSATSSPRSARSQKQRPGDTETSVHR